jgi:hypothetical protein
VSKLQELQQRLDLMQCDSDRELEIAKIFKTINKRGDKVGN